MSTITLRNTKGSALTFTEMDNNFSNLNTDKIESIVTDTTPQLGGNLDVNGNSIVSTSAGNIAITPDTTGNIVLDGLNWPQADGSTGQYLKTDGAGNLSWDDPDTDTNTTYTTSAVDSGDNAIIRLTGSDASTDDITLVAGSNITLTPVGDNITIAATSGGISNVVEDTTPQLGGDLDVQSNKITTASASPLQIEGATNQNVELLALGTGDVKLTPAVNGDSVVARMRYDERMYDLGTTDTPSIDPANGNVQEVAITSGLTLPAFTGASAGQSVTLLVAGSGTCTGTVNHKFAGGNTTLTTDSVVSIFYDGAEYWVSIATDFQ